MVTPDKLIIIEILLISLGFKESKILSNKLYEFLKYTE